VTRKVLCFAYGSNMLTKRIRARVSSASVLCTGFISGHRLTFDKISRDRSGKCDAEHTKARSDRVYGVVYEIDVRQKGYLDAAEGLGTGYAEKIATVTAKHKEITASLYYATQKDAVLKPYHWYKEFVLAGAREHNLPDAYVEQIESVDSIEDPDPHRRAKNEKILHG
jgi:gamma-glutamylcyclotransferase